MHEHGNIQRYVDIDNGGEPVTVEISRIGDYKECLGQCFSYPDVAGGNFYCRRSDKIKQS